MSKVFSRRIFLASALSALAARAQAGAPAVSLRPQVRPEGLGKLTAPSIDALISEARLGGNVALAVIDPATGKVLETRDAGLGLPPASVTKALTALYALDALGGAHRFETRLVATGQVRDGVLAGDLVLAGGGDPMLDTDALADMAKELREAGIRRVDGKFLTHAGDIPFTRMLDPGQPEHVGYNPTLSGLTLNFNRVHFGWERRGQEYSVVMDARSARHRPSVNIARMSVADRSTPVYTYDDGGDHDSWTVARSALGNGGSRWLPVRRPEAYAAEVFAHFARVEGIELRHAGQLDTPPGGKVLVRRASPPLTEILRGMLKYSNNLTAELVGLAATRQRQGQPVDVAASARAMTFWAREALGMADARLADHSGLSEASRMTAEGMARALARVHGEAALAPILKPFAMRDGAAGNGADQLVKVRAKTGTLYFVSSLAGYVTGADGRDLAFAILTANLDLRADIDSRQEARPPGSVAWNRRSRQLQQNLIARWNVVYGS